MNPGDCVKLREYIHTPLHDVPPGTGGVVIWADMRRGQASVAFVGFGQIDNVPTAWLEPAAASFRALKRKQAAA